MIHLVNARFLHHTYDNKFIYHPFASGVALQQDLRIL